MFYMPSKVRLHVSIYKNLPAIILLCPLDTSSRHKGGRRGMAGFQISGNHFGFFILSEQFEEIFRGA
jgi:hypothetical protein